MPNTKRKLPNVLVTGTPGVGKSTLCEKVCKKSGFKWLQVSTIAKEHECFDGYDEDLKCPILDEDKLLDTMEDMMAPGGQVVDYHSSDFFPERWFDMVFIIRTDNTILYDRLVERGYSGKKLENNVACEIFETVAEEAKSSYKEECVVELVNNSQEDLKKNVSKITKCIREWKNSVVDK